MALADYQPERRDVLLRGKPLFSVQGLSLEGLALLVRTHLPDFEGIFDLLGMGENLQQSVDLSMDRVALRLVTSAPGLTANIIAVASGEDLDVAIEHARKLPFPLQLEALIQIGELTFEEVGGIKKCGETLAILLTKLRMGRSPVTAETHKVDSSTSTKASDVT